MAVGGGTQDGGWFSLKIEIKGDLGDLDKDERKQLSIGEDDRNQY